MVILEYFRAIFTRTELGKGGEGGVGNESGDGHGTSSCRPHANAISWAFEHSYK